MPYGNPPTKNLAISDAKRDPKEEEAYQVWSRLPNRLNRGALTTVSKRTGVKLAKLNDWFHRYSWRQRWTDEISAISVPLKNEASTIINASLPEAAERLREIIAHGSDRDAVFATRALQNLATTIDPAAAGRGVPSVTIVEKQLVLDYKSLTPEQLFAMERDAALSNVEQATSLRVSKNRQLPSRTG